MKSPLYNVLHRELCRMTSRRLYLGVCLVLPLFCLFFMATIFGSGQMENIPIGIVDQDNTATSRQIARNISAVPTFSVTRHFTDEAAARQAVQRKEIYGYLSIPTGFEQHATTGMDATLSYYYHYALLSVGSELMAAFETALAPVALSPIAMEAISLGLNQEQITTFLLPVQASMHPLYNPDLDYSVYLSQPFFYVLFQILILLMTVYAIGSEIKFNTAQEWLTTARGNILTAVIGKLLPYTFIFSVIGILANYILYGVVHIPFHGSLLMMNLMTLIFIIATQALAVFIFSIFPRIAYIISIVSMIAWGLGYFGMPHILLRFMAIEDEEKLKLSRRVATGWVVISLAVAVLIGIIGLAMTAAGELIPLEGSASETIIVKIADLMSQHGVLPALLAGTILAGILASTMSTADSQLLAASSSVSSDLLGDFLKKKTGKKGSMFADRMTLLIIALVAVFLARDPNSSVFNIVSFAWAGFGAVFGPVVLFALFWKRSNWQGALAGMISGGAMVFIWKYLVRPLGGAWDIYELLPAFLVSCAAIVLVSLLTKAPSKEIVEEFESV